MPQSGDVALPNPGDTCDYYTWSDVRGWIPTYHLQGRGHLWSTPVDQGDADEG